MEANSLDRKVRRLRILGIRGIPAAHGGFETFAERLALFLVAAGWEVTVYCQHDGEGARWEDDWCGVRRVNIPVAVKGAKGTVIFDWLATVHASRERSLCLTLGYNTAIFSLLLRLRGIPNVTNMDGIEWARAKWSGLAKTWFWLNDWAGCWISDGLVADHPEIQKHLATRVRADKITMIPYGADPLLEADSSVLEERGLAAGEFITVIARAEPENSLLEIVSAFSEKRRGVKLVVLGNLDPDNSAYHARVVRAASAEVVFLGAIYERRTVQALRFFSLLYVHGHQVGGTNPSLVEALGAGNPVVAHDNRYNRWAAGEGAAYFGSVSELSGVFDRLIGNRNATDAMRVASRQKFESVFRWDDVLRAYQRLLERNLV